MIRISTSLEEKQKNITSKGKASEIKCEYNRSGMPKTRWHIWPTIENELTAKTQLARCKTRHIKLGNKRQYQRRNWQM